MSKQLTVRLPEDLVEFIDRQVAGGDATSRAAVIALALQGERRRQVAQRDASILARADAADDFGVLAAFAAQVPLDDLA